MSPDVAESGGHDAGLASPQPGVLLLLSLPILLCTVASCTSVLPHRSEQADKAEEDPFSEAMISETEAAIYECVLRFLRANDGFWDDSIHVLTFTDNPRFCDPAVWLNPSTDFLGRVADLGVDFLRPCDVYHTTGSVYQDRLTKDMVLHWVSIDKWIDASTVEVEVGHCFGQHVGGGRLTLWKRDGMWTSDPH